MAPTRAMIRMAWTFSARDVRLHKFRSALTVLAISVGVASFVSLRLVSVGVHAKVREEVEQLISADLIVYGEGACDVPEFVCEFVKSMPYVEDVASVVIVQGWVESGWRKYMANIIGCDARSLRNFFNLSVTEGRAFSDEERGVALINEDVARSLGVGVGKSVVIKPQVVTGGQGSYVARVVGVVRATAKVGGLSIFNCCIVPLRDAQELVGAKGYVTYVLVKLSDRSCAKLVRREIRRVFPGALVTEQKEILMVIGRVVKTVTGMIVATTLIGVVVAFFAVANTVMMNVREHIRDIGILKALGATSRYVMALFVLEALLMSTVGGLAGLALGVVGSHALRRLLPRLGVSFAVPIVVDSGTLTVGFLLAVGVGALASLYPSWRASKISPVEALRHE